MTGAELDAFQHRWDVFVNWSYAGGVLLLLAYVVYLVALHQRLKRQADELAQERGAA
jgi:hypothetical protein